MYGVTKISVAGNIMLVNFQGASPAFMAQTLQNLASAGVVVDMISQTAPFGNHIHFSFTADFLHFDATIHTIGGKDDAKPMISGGYSKINLYGQEMVESVGVAARALDALAQGGVDIVLITTSDLDISLLVRQEDEDVALQTLQKAFEV